MSKEITRESFTEAMRDSVAERGEDFVYPDDWKVGGACQYRINGEPACLIGMALDKLGRIPKYNKAAENVLEDCGVYDQRLQSAARAAQMAQDGGLTWGYALEVFEREMAD